MFKPRTAVAIIALAAAFPAFAQVAEDPVTDPAGDPGVVTPADPVLDDPLGDPGADPGADPVPGPGADPVPMDPMDTPEAPAQDPVVDPGIDPLADPLAADPLVTDPVLDDPLLDDPLADPALSGGVDRSLLTVPEGYVSADLMAYTAEQIIGTDVLDPEGNVISSISDIEIGSDNQVTQLIADFGGFLGIGQRSVALSPDQVALYTDANNNLYVYVTMMREELEALPEYTPPGENLR